MISLIEIVARAMVEPQMQKATETVSSFSQMPQPAKEKVIAGAIAIIAAGALAAYLAGKPEQP